MSGNFDYPPASGSNSNSNSNPGTRFQSLRQVIQREREQMRRGWDEAAEQRQREDSSSPMPSTSSPPSHRRIANIRNSPRFRQSDRRVTHSSEGPPSSLGRRPRQYPRESSTSNQIYRRGAESMDALAEMGRASERLGELAQSLIDTNETPSSRFRSMNFPSIDSFLANEGLPASNDDNEVERPRLKRRRLGQSEHEEAFPKYGYHGQVVAGPLKMEMASCDGGQFRNDTASIHQPENVLRNDISVYCTEKGVCNVLLCHQGETLFTLEKLTIKSPNVGYTSPVQEGLVFVSMSSKGLTRSANRYKIRYLSAPQTAVRNNCPVNDRIQRHVRMRSRSQDREQPDSEGEGLTFMESLHDPGLLELYEARRTAERPQEPQSIFNQDLEDHGLYLRQRGLADPCDYSTNTTEIVTLPPTRQSPGARDFRAPTPPPHAQIRVTTNHSEESNELDEDSISPEILIDRRDRERRWRPASPLPFYSGVNPTTGVDDDEEDDLLPPLDLLWRETSTGGSITGSAPAASRFMRYYDRDRESRTPYFSARRGKRRSRASQVELADMTWGEEKEHVAPIAKFFIPEDKSSVTICFDPPISGKFVMLRLWSPYPGGNIDVQSVGVTGWAGPRFFPAEEVV